MVDKPADSFLARALDVVSSVGELRGKIGEGFAFDFQVAGLVAKVIADPAHLGTGLDYEPMLTDLVSMPQTLCEVQVVRKLCEGVAQVINGVVNMFVRTVELEALHLVNSGVVVKGDDFKSIVEQLVDPGKMRSSIAASVLKFRQTDCKEEVTLKRASAGDLLEMLLSVSAATEIMPTSIVGAGKAVPKEEFLAVCYTMRAAHSVASVFGFLFAEVRNLPSCIVEHHIRRDIVEAIKVADSTCQDVLATMQAQENLYKSVETFILPTSLASPSRVRIWMEASVSACIELRKILALQAMADCTKIAAHVEKITPKYDHFLNDSTFVTSLARRHLVAPNPNRDALNKEVVALYHSIAQVNSFCIESGMGLAKDISDIAEGLEHANAVFNGGKAALMVAVAAKVVLALKGKEQAGEAAALLKKASATSLPKSLSSELAKLAKGASLGAVAPAAPMLRQVKKVAKQEDDGEVS